MKIVAPHLAAEMEALFGEHPMIWARATCAACGYKHLLLRPLSISVTRFECPLCHAMASRDDGPMELIN